MDNQTKSWLNVPVAEGSQVQPYQPPLKPLKKLIAKFTSPRMLLNACFVVLMLILIGAATSAPEPTKCVEVCPTIDYPPLSDEPEIAFVEPQEKSEASPISVKRIKKTYAEEAKAYVERYHEIAQSEMKRYGIPASISLAQGLIESRAGTSKLAINNNNHFGMKCFSRNCKKGHCTNFTDDTHKDFFKKFKTPWESWRAHSQLLASGRYTKLKKHGRDYRKWAYGLQSVGYATDRNYAEKLIAVIKAYKLDRYD